MWDHCNVTIIKKSHSRNCGNGKIYIRHFITLDNHYFMSALWSYRDWFFSHMHLIAQWEISTSKLYRCNLFLHHVMITCTGRIIIWSRCFHMLLQVSNIRTTGVKNCESDDLDFYFLGLESKQCHRSFDSWRAFILGGWISDGGYNARGHQCPKNFDQREPDSDRLATFSDQSKDSTTNSADGWHVASKYRARHHRDAVETSAWRSG